MKTRNIFQVLLIIAIVMLVLQIPLMAQPLPPLNPNNAQPVPVDGITAMLIVSFVGTAFLQLRKKK